ncbi:MAG: bifunctional alpha,alpha-trehalose-phosphate synthase (UDP-forming)/trehalose-phosphatase, partial [Clostridia bacterium]|nr:bifunctional alpha,alpha-trehalose-phosphate synthase (UDP-forming)/trehalose-phosphatase [Clostridia bacterium]
MSKTIFISNRLPITVKREGDDFAYEKSIGGLATGLKNYHDNTDNVWIGWPGVPSDTLDTRAQEKLAKELEKKYKCLPVFLSECDVEMFYYGFCNKTIWPLFHYFINKTEYEEELWEAYQDVNRRFFDKVVSIISED